MALSTYTTPRPGVATAFAVRPSCSPRNSSKPLISGQSLVACRYVKFISATGGTMSKEFDKFQSDYKKIAPKLTSYTKAAADKLFAKISSTYTTTILAGERHLAESTAVARGQGVVGDKIQDFMKNKAFADALKAYDVSVGFVKEAQDAMNKFSLEAREVCNSLATLQKAIEKDLKSRKDSSATKTDIEKLKKQIEGDFQGCEYAADRAGKVPLVQANYVANFQKNVDKILKAAPETQQEKLDDTMLPQLLVDRNIKKATTHSLSLTKKIAELCDSAIDQAATDVKLAAPLLKEAAGLLIEVKKTSETYAKALEHSKKQLEKSTEKDKIYKSVETIGKAYEASERRIRGTATTIKKAG